MCLAVPAKVLRIKGDLAYVDFGDGTTRTVNIALVEAKIGMYVLVHAGYAIETMNPEDAQETLKLLQEYVKAMEEKPKR
ncbi:MAG: HypC/HybG/HupF family hydrogenase formation chaperone [Candidatus Ranarchaeia archaeon]